MTDPVDLMVQAVASSLARHGVSPMVSVLEAEDLVQRLLDTLGQAGAPVGHYLRRVRVYTLKSRGVRTEAIAMRLGVCPRTVHRDYVAEYQRRRSA